MKKLQEQLQSLYESLYENRRKIEDNSLLKLREKAFELFLKLEKFDPEIWKYTPITQLFQKELQPLTKSPNTPELKPPLNTKSPSAKLIFSNGKLNNFTNPGQLQLHPLDKALQSDELQPIIKSHWEALLENWKGNPFILLNLAFAESGILFIAPQATEESPTIEVVYSSDTQKFGGLPWWNTLNIFHFPRDSRAEITEILHGKGSYLSNITSSTHLEPNGKAKFIKVQIDSENSFGFYNTLLNLESSSKADIYSFGFGGKINRTEIRSQLRENGAECQIDGMYLAGSSQSIEHFINLEHLAPHCESSQFFRAVLADKGKGLFTGKIFVAPDAQKTNAYQKHDAILLSHYSQVYARPQLEIFADDVRCSHGATSGRLDRNALFYLRTRGLQLPEAKQLLTTAFANTVIQKIDRPEFQKQLEKLFLQKLEPYLR